MTTKHFWLLSLIILFLFALAACSSSPTIEEPAPDLQVVEPVQEIVLEPTKMPASTISALLPEIVEATEPIVETAVLPSASSSTLTDTLVS